MAISPQQCFGNKRGVIFMRSEAAPRVLMDANKKEKGY